MHATLTYPALPGGRFFTKSSVRGYRFGFNGQMKDDEVYGEGNSYTAEYWQYDPRLGRRWNVDPAFDLKPWMSSYHAFSNKPITNTDPNGALDDEWNYNTVTGEKTKVSDLGGDKVQFVNFVTPHENGGMVLEGTAVLEGSEVFAGSIRGGWAASSADLWSGIPENYNSNSYDYLKGGSYEYSLLDLKKRYEVFNNPELLDYQSIISGWEASGNAQAIHLIEFSKQYKAKWGTNSSFWYAIEHGYWDPADIPTILNDALIFLKNVRQPQRVFKYAPMYPGSLPGKLPENTWNRFLKETKGTYSGKDWQRKASDDYKIWKQNKGL